MKNIAKAVDKHRNLILAAERYIWQHPETGYKEFRTSSYMAEQFEKLGYTLTYPENLTGFTAISDANKRVNRAFTGAALSLDTNVEIIDIPGYAPFVNDEQMLEMCKKAAAEILPHVEMKHHRAMGTGSTDIGDLSRIMPTVQPYIGGATGTSHGNDYHITDPKRACVDAAKWQLAMAKLLLVNGAALAKKIIADFKPEFPTKEAYLAYMDALNASGERIRTLGEDTLAVKI